MNLKFHMQHDIMAAVTINSKANKIVISSRTARYI